MTALMRPLLAGLRVGDRIGKTVVGRIERLHFGGAVVASVARRDALLVGTQSVDDLGDGRRMAIGGIAAIGPVGVRGDEQGKCEEAGGKAMQSDRHSGQGR